MAKAKSKVVASPLEQLIEANERVAKTRKRKARPRHPEVPVELAYRSALANVIRAAQEAVERHVLPALERASDEFVKDSAIVTRDTWADRVIEALEQAIAQSMGSQLMEAQFRRLAQGIVNRANEETTEAVIRNINEAVGVDLRPMLREQGMADYISISTKQNVELIKSVTSRHFDRIENAVLGGVRDGSSLAKIRRDIQEATSVSKKRAKLIARDQSAKLTSEITERRHTQAGIEHYRAVTANDNRVTGRPGGKYPNAKISCWGISKQDIGYGPGVYRWDKGATWGGQTGLHPGRHHVQCRCTSVPVFKWELPNNAQ